MKYAESYNIYTNVKDSKFKSVPKTTTAYTLKDIDGDNVPVVWVTAIVDGKESLPSAIVTVPTVNVTCKIAICCNILIVIFETNLRFC